MFPLLCSSLQGSRCLPRVAACFPSSSSSGCLCWLSPSQSCAGGQRLHHALPPPQQPLACYPWSCWVCAWCGSIPASRCLPLGSIPVSCQSQGRCSPGTTAVAVAVAFLAP